jgi:hypothetical protein
MRRISIVVFSKARNNATKSLFVGCPSKALQDELFTSGTMESTPFPLNDIFTLFIAGVTVLSALPCLLTHIHDTI